VYPGESGQAGQLAAGNGAVLEQSQILTTHNLAVLIDTLGLGEQVTAPAPQLAERTLQWVVHRMAVRTDNRHAAPQAVFHLSYCDQNTQHAAAERLGARVREAGLEGRFGPAADGLAAVIAGGPLHRRRHDPRGPALPRWSIGPHRAL
jgi:hypothetical protein